MVNDMAPRVDFKHVREHGDFDAVCNLANNDPALLDGLVTHCMPANQADEGYRTAFSDPLCLKMILDWTGAPTH